MDIFSEAVKHLRWTPCHRKLGAGVFWTCKTSRAGSLPQEPRSRCFMKLLNIWSRLLATGTQFEVFSEAVNQIITVCDNPDNKERRGCSEGQIRPAEIEHRWWAHKYPGCCHTVDWRKGNSFCGLVGENPNGRLTKLTRGSSGHAFLSNHNIPQTPGIPSVYI